MENGDEEGAQGGREGKWARGKEDGTWRWGCMRRRVGEMEQGLCLHPRGELEHPG